MGTNQSDLKSAADPQASLSISQQETKQIDQIPKQHQHQNHDIDKFIHFLETKALVSIYPSPDAEILKIPIEGVEDLKQNRNWKKLLPDKIHM